MGPLIRVSPSTEQKLDILGQAARFDLSCACGPSDHRSRGVDGRWIYPAALPSGRRVPMLKVLLQSGCERGCSYCVERRGGTANGVSFEPLELARLFDTLYRQGRVFGLFLSSAIRSGALASMDRLIDTAEILRSRFSFRGYLHLKILPGARPDQIEHAMRLATRVSVNLEAPTAARLARIAPSKVFESDILAPMRQVARAEIDGRFARSGQTTQLVVGAADETDREIGKAASLLYGQFSLARVYYSAFQPVPGTPLENRPPTPFAREHRLYQMDFLIRKYGFAIDEIPFEEDGNLSLRTDPKTAWAEAHPERFPLEINSAEPAELLRIPGIGPRTAERIVNARRDRKIRNLEDLREMGASADTAAWILIDGRRPPRQLRLGGL